LPYLLLAVAQVAGLLLIPFGLPGLWVQVGALAIFAWATDFATVGLYSVSIVFFLALLAEIAEFLFAGGFAKHYGGGRRAAVGAMLGALAGAMLGVPVPLLGSVIGAMLGAFVGAMLLELTRGVGATPAARAGWGALLGWITAVALKAGLGVAIAVFTLFIAIR
jgi:uncharacterized protein YqgC (DUF456 family)